MPLELRLPTLTKPDPQAVLAWAGELVLQLRRQFVPVLKRVQPLVPYGLQTEDGTGNLFTPLLFKTDTAIIDVASSATATAMVRPGLCFGVFAQNITAIVGPASYDIGMTVPFDQDAWGFAHTTASQAIDGTPNNPRSLEQADEWLRPEDFTFNPPVLLTAPTDIVLTPNGGAFVSGTVKLISFTLDFKMAA